MLCYAWAIATVIKLILLTIDGKVNPIPEHSGSITHSRGKIPDIFPEFFGTKRKRTNNSTLLSNVFIIRSIRATQS